jgi:hypothetical protein
MFDEAQDSAETIMIAPTVRRSLRGRSERRAPAAQSSVEPASAATASKTNIPAKPDGAAAGALAIPAPTRETMIREAAYFLSEHRGFAPGAELEDWFAAERDVDRILSSG